MSGDRFDSDRSASSGHTDSESHGAGMDSARGRRERNSIADYSSTCAVYRRTYLSCEVNRDGSQIGPSRESIHDSETIPSGLSAIPNG